MTTTIRLFKVGGCVRDEMLGVRTKDIDFSVEVSRRWLRYFHRRVKASFDAMREFLIAEGFRIYVEKPEFLTIRAKFPKGHQHEGTDADFVLCRKDSPTSDGRRPDFVKSGTIFDDLARRDFTVNAMAIDEDGKLLDPHGGQADLEKMVLRCVGDPMVRFNEDGLRALRAVRFVITKGFRLESETKSALMRAEVRELLAAVSTERVREELTKCFAADTMDTIRLLDELGLLDTVFHRHGLWLKPTMEEG